ncbi:MAG: hypothetical protein HZR80_10550 [Candidatus Heimdallarchaeota archaeon]
MRNRIDILKEIMEIEKKYALEEIDSEDFENRMQLLEKQLKNTNVISEEDLLRAIDSREIPLSANRMVGRISIEDLLPTFNVPRTFFRHLKIEREIKELDRNIYNLEHNLQKLKILQAEKKINTDTANIKIETLEFDLRLAHNRFAAREKYLKRNPSKAELLKFTLENYLRFSFGHGITNETELKELSSDLQKEIKIRQKYRKALAEMLATVKTTQLEISTTKSRNGLPDFKQLLEIQQSVNELKVYIRILSNDIKEYCNCLSLLQDDILKIDHSHDLFIPEEFGIEIEAENQTIEIQKKKKQIAPLLETLEIEGLVNDPISYFLIDTTDSITIPEEVPSTVSEEPTDEFVIPDTPQPIYEPKLDLEIIGMEDFSQPFSINGSTEQMNVFTEQIIFESYEGLLEKLIDPEVEKPKPQPKPVESKAEFSSLTSDLKKTKGIVESYDKEFPGSIEVPETPQELELEVLTNDITVIEEIEAIPSEELMDIESTDDMVVTETSEEVLDIPAPPPDYTITHEITEEPQEFGISTTETEIIPEQIVTPAEIKPEILDQVEEDLIKPQKTSMILPKLLEAATEAWKLSGKALFNLVEDVKREFLGYLQEVIVFDKNKLGFTLVSEASADQSIIDNIFDQIKPLWVTEEYMESTEKRKNYLISEVMESLQIQKDVALHITRLQEFANFRNINYPTEEQIHSQEILGIVPIDKIRIKRGSVICSPDNIVAPQPYRTAPWDGKLITSERTPIGKECCLSQGIKVGKVIAIVKHPLMGKLLLIDTREPDTTLVNYLVDRLEIIEDKPKERLWLVKYLIAKQLRIPEGEALKPRTLINYSLNRGFPILPNEILNTFRVFVSGGSVDKIGKKSVILRNSSRVFYPSEIFPIECLRVRTTNGRHIGTCLGLSLSDNPVLLVSEKLSREVVVLFTNATVEKEVISDISQSVTGSIGVELKDSLCTHNIFKSLISGRKIQTLAEYGKFLSMMNVTGIDLSEMQVVEKGTIFVISPDAPGSNIFQKQ